MRDSLASLLPILPEDIQRAAVMDSLCRLHNEGDTARLQAAPGPFPAITKKDGPPLGKPSFPFIVRKRRAAG